MPSSPSGASRRHTLPPLPEQALPASHVAPPVDLIALDPRVQDADALLSRLGAHQVHEYADIVRRLALGKQDAAKALVSRSYTDLLAVATRVSHMASSLDTLCGALDDAASATRGAADSASATATRLAHQETAHDSRPLVEAASVLLAADSPRLADTALQSGQYLSAAWVLLAADAASASLDTQLYPYVAQQHGRLAQSRSVVVRAAADALGDLLHPSTVLQGAAALAILDGKSDASILALFLEHCSKHARDALRPRGLGAEAALAAAAQNLADAYCKTLAYAERLFSPRHGASALLRLLTSGSAAWGAPVLDTAVHSAWNARILAQLAPHVRAPVVDVRGTAVLNDTDVHVVCASWAQQVQSELQPLDDLVARIDDLDAVSRCRAAVTSALGESPSAVSSMRLALLTRLSLRENVLTEQTLRHATSEFADLVDDALEHADPVPWPRTVARMRPPRVQQITAHVEERFRHARGHGSLPHACELLAHALMERAGPRMPAWIMHMCSALYDSGTLRALLKDTPTHMYDQLRNAHSAAAAHWVEQQIQAVRKHTAAQTTDKEPDYPSNALLGALLGAVRAQRAAGVAGDALAPPALCAPVLQAWAGMPHAPSAQREWDIAFCVYLLDAAQRAGTAGAGADSARKALTQVARGPPDAHAARSVPIAAAQLSVSLAPWLHRTAVSRSEAPARAAGVPLARVGTRFVPA